MQPYAYGETSLSVRFNRLEDYMKADEKIKKVIPKSKYKKTLHFQIDGGLRRPPMIESEQSEEIFNFVNRIARTLDNTLSREHRWSSSDLCFIDADKYILDGMGPTGQKPQDRSEYILRHSFNDRALLLAVTLVDAQLNKYKFD